MNSKIAVGVLISLFGIINSFISSRLVDAATTDFLGAWVNVDSETGGLAALNFVSEAAGFEVQGFGACGDPGPADDCDYGFTTVHFLGDSISDTNPTWGIAVWDPGYAETTLVIHLEGDQLVAETFTIFKDDSGRENYRVRYLMRRSQSPPPPPPEPGLPPDPGEAGKATLEGIDSDNDGVRDDVQRHIALTVTDSARHREALRNVAKVIQRELLAQTKEEAIQLAIEGVRTVECLSYLEVLEQGRRKEVQALMLNTEARLRAMDAHADRITGQVFTSLPESLKRSACTFDVEALPN